METYYLPEMHTGLQTAELTGRELHHCIHVMRHKAGDAVRIVNGSGGVFVCRISAVKRDAAVLVLVEEVNVSGIPPRSVTIGIAPPRKPARMEFCVEKLTELGITRIVPLMCRNSEKPSLNHDRMKHILVSALKQSQRTVLPVLDEMTAFREFVSSDVQGAWCGIAMRHQESRSLSGYDLGGRDVVFLVGPEGDFTEEEFAFALRNGFKPVALDEYRLRTETASIAMLSVIQSMT